MTTYHRYIAAIVLLLSALALVAGAYREQGRQLLQERAMYEAERAIWREEIARWQDENEALNARLGNVERGGQR